MNGGEGWDGVEQLFRRLYEAPAEERRRTLETTEDPHLRAEVEVLLETYDRLSREEPAFLSQLDSVRVESLLRSGGIEGERTTIGRYHIVRTLGSGGMGVVLQAHDPILDRPVALKLLPPFLSANPDAVRRLRDEARAASALDHPQIETVYEIGEADDGRVFIAMAHYEGETLRERICRGPMPIADVLDLGLQLAAGLAAAHRAGIVHRDIKPENLLVTREGVLKIVDFGVAKLVRDGLATTGPPRGTAAYMSPEQTRGETVDFRTDLWSAGVVLYEMLAGKRPFAAEGEALIHAIRHDAPVPLSRARPGAPIELAEWIDRCLERDREDRPASAEELHAGLRKAAERPATGAGGGRLRFYGRLAGATATVALGIVLVAGYLRGDRVEAPPPAGTEALPAVAVLPFQVRGEGVDVWREGMVDLLSIGLDGSSGLRAIDSRTVLAHWRATGPEGRATTLENALEVAGRTGARYAVIGSAISAGPSWRLGARLHRVADGNALASFQVEGPPDSLFALADRLAIDILASIWHGEERPRRHVDLARITTASLPALKSYLEGESRLRRADYAGAIAAYERAIEADSTFAYALFHLGLAYSWMGEADRMLASYDRASRHAGRLPEREAVLLRAASPPPGTDLATAIGRLEEATRRYPDDADAWYFLGELYWHDGEEARVGPEASEKAFRKVVELDPGFAPGYPHLVTNLFAHWPDSARAARLIEIQHRLSPDTWADQHNQIAFGLAFGDSTSRARASAALDTLSVGSRWWLADAYFDHPLFRSLQAEVIEWGPWTGEPPGGLVTGELFATELIRGRVRAARGLLDDPRLLPGLRAAGFYRFHSAGHAVPLGELDEALGVAAAAGRPDGSQSILTWFYAGAYAADRARWEDHAAAVEGLEAVADRLLAAGDSTESRFASLAASALRGKGYWAREDPARGLPLLLEAQRRGTLSNANSAKALNRTLRWWIGEILLATGRPREAALYFESFWNDPWAAERLAPIYERMGEPGKARAAWVRVALSWRDGDPELQIRARAARAAVRRLDRPAG